MHLRITPVQLMTRSILLRSFIAMAAMAIAATPAAEVYTWKDADGRVHFSDQPPANADIKPTKPAAGPRYAPAVPEAAATQSGARAQSEPKAESKPPLATQSGPKTWQEKELDVKQRRATEQEAEAKRKQEETRADEQKRYCEGLRNNLTMLERGGRITRTNANGERVFLEDGQIKQEAERVRGQLARDCK